MIITSIHTKTHLLSHVVVFLVRANTTTTTTIPPPAASNTPQLTPTAMYLYVVISSLAVGLTSSVTSISVACSTPSCTSISATDIQMYSIYTSQINGLLQLTSMIS